MIPRYLTTLAEILRSTLYLIDFYEDRASGLKALSEAKGCIRKAITELETAIATAGD
jgi:hypothetical protein